MNIAIMAGGPSSERVISLQTAENIAQKFKNAGFSCFLIDVNMAEWIYDPENLAVNVDKNDFSLCLNEGKITFDYVVIAIHGKQGEDGLLQAYFDLLNIPYSSCGVLCSALTFDKILCKQFLSSYDDIPLAKQFVVCEGDVICAQDIVELLGLPVFVKPNTAGSSFGVTKVYNANEIEEAIKRAYKEDSKVIVEEFIEGVEVSCGVIKTSERELVLPVTEIDTQNDFFDYEAKYNAELTKEITPARIPKVETEAVQNLTSKIYDLTGCEGIVRIDFIIKNGKPYFLEVNSIPGMSPNSIVPKQVRCIGMTEQELLCLAMEDSLFRFEKTHL